MPCPIFDEINFAAHLGACQQADFSGNHAFRYSFFGNTELLVNLQRAGMHAECLGIRGDTFFFIEDDKINAVAHELAGQREPGGACADNQYICLFC